MPLFSANFNEFNLNPTWWWYNILRENRM